MKTSTVTRTIFAALALTFALPFAAQARSYEACMAVRHDPPGCYLSWLFGGDYIAGPDFSDVSETDKRRIDMLTKKGVFAVNEKQVSKVQPTKGKFQQTCKTSDLLTMFEKGAKPEMIAKSCYK